MSDHTLLNVRQFVQHHVDTYLSRPAKTKPEKAAKAPGKPAPAKAAPKPATHAVAPVAAGPKSTWGANAKRVDEVLSRPLSTKP